MEDENQVLTEDNATTDVENIIESQETNESNNAESIDAEFTDIQEDEVVQNKAKGQKDANYAKLRRQKEQKEKNEEYNRGILDAVDNRNPYTGEPIEDEVDLQEYKIMKEIAKMGKDPVADFRKYAKDKERKTFAENKEKIEQQRLYEKDVNDFSEKYPNKLKELTKDERFAVFAKGKVGRVPLTDIYEDYLSFNGMIEAMAKEKAEKMYSNALSTTGSLSTVDDTREKSYLNMSDAEFEKIYQQALNGNLSKK